MDSPFEYWVAATEGCDSRRRKLGSGFPPIFCLLMRGYTEIGVQESLERVSSLGGMAADQIGIFRW